MKVFQIEVAKLQECDLFIVRTPNPKIEPFVSHDWNAVKQFILSN